MNHVGDWIRILLSVVLLYLVYGETGPVTTFCIFLTMVRAEVQDLNAGLTFKDTTEGD